MSGIKDKVIVITGAGSGIDEAAALLLERPTSKAKALGWETVGFFVTENQIDSRRISLRGRLITDEGMKFSA